jgi:hypothetical protein
MSNGNEIMLALSNEVEQNDRYQSLSPMSAAGFADRKHERNHVVVIRQLEREARESVAGDAVEAIEDIAWIQARARVNTEAKFAIERAQKESEILAQGDAEKRMKFAILDDEFFAQTRILTNRPRGAVRGKLFG